MFGEDAFGMELQSYHWIVSVAQGHDFAVAGEGGDLQAFRQGFLDDQGVIAGGLEWAGHAGEDSFLFVIDR
jgi:hypothetical protein